MPERPPESASDSSGFSLDVPDRVRLRLPTPKTQTRWLIGVAVVVLASIFGLALVHISDRMRVDHVAGAWMAFTHYADQGQWYPPLFDGQRYAGTRWMPLALLYNLAFAQLSPSLLFTGKLASLFGALAIAGLLYRLLRQISVEPAFAVLLVAVVAVSDPLLIATWAPFRGDSLSLALQLLAVVWVLRAPQSTQTAVAAGTVCALALLGKLSAGWAPMAIGLFYLLHSRRRLGAFVASYAVILVGGLLVFEALSEGRMLQGLVDVSTGQFTWQRMLGAPRRVLHALAQQGQPLLILLPFACMELVLAWVRGRLTMVHALFGAVLIINLVVFADIGTASNHLVDLGCLSAVMVGALWVRLEHEGSGVRALLTTLVLGALLVGVDVGLLDRLQELRRGTAAYGLEVYEDLAEPQHRLLSEDPALPVRLGQHPVVMDAFMWRRLADRRPGEAARLVERIHRQEFDRIVLLQRAESGLASGWYVDMHFGRAVLSEILSRYDLLRTTQGYWVYVPKSS